MLSPLPGNLSLVLLPLLLVSPLVSWDFLGDPPAFSQQVLKASFELPGRNPTPSHGTGKARTTEDPIELNVADLVGQELDGLQSSDKGAGSPTA